MFLIAVVRFWLEYIFSLQIRLTRGLYSLFCYATFEYIETIFVQPEYGSSEYGGGHDDDAPQQGAPSLRRWG